MIIVYTFTEPDCLIKGCMKSTTMKNSSGRALQSDAAYIKAAFILCKRQSSFDIQDLHR